MLITPNRNNLNTIVVLNPKGGCGKTTLATNICSYYAKLGQSPTLMDCDPQGSSMRWLDARDSSRPAVHGIAAFRNTMHKTRSWQLRVPADTQNLVVDSPAGLGHDRLRELTRDATSILIPVLPSAIDIHAASKCIADLLLVAKIDRRDNKLAVVANRTKASTNSFDKLMRFLDSLGIPIIAVMRDSQNFVRAAEDGIGVCDLAPSAVRKDMDEMNKIIFWLDSWRSRGGRPEPRSRDRAQAPATVTPLRQAQSGAG